MIQSIMVAKPTFENLLLNCGIEDLGTISSRAAFGYWKGVARNSKKQFLGLKSGRRYWGGGG